MFKTLHKEKYSFFYNPTDDERKYHEHLDREKHKTFLRRLKQKHREIAQKSIFNTK